MKMDGDPGRVKFSMSLNPDGQEPLDFDVSAYVTSNQYDRGELEVSIADSEDPMSVEWGGEHVPNEVFMAMLGDDAKLHEAASEAVMDAARAADVKPGWYHAGAPHDRERVCRVLGSIKHAGQAVWSLVTTEDKAPGIVVGKMGLHRNLIELAGADARFPFRLELRDPTEFTDEFKRIEVDPGEGKLRNSDAHYVESDDALYVLGSVNADFDYRAKELGR